MLRTFFDSGVPRAAARSVGPDRERALQLLEDPNRSFLTSPFVHLEVLPKAVLQRGNGSSAARPDAGGIAGTG
jgi:hypothetical protein